ncbi:MAG: efflux RND transporter permease subunit, partial [Dehalococcoidia bacterium]
MRWIVGTSLKYRFLVVLMAAAMVFFGTWQLRNSPVDVFPEFAPPLVEIQTPALGLSPEEVESLVTIPLEDALTGLPNLEEMRSKSVPQLSSIKLIFERGTDPLLARQLVQERLASVVVGTIPSDVGPPVMLQPLSATSRVMKIGLSSDQYSMMELSMITYWKIRARLLGVPGVAHVAIWGERLQMLQVQADLERMQEENVSLDQVMEATSNSLDAGLLEYSDWGSTIGTGGWVETPNQRLQVRHVLPIITPGDLAEVTFQGSDGQTLLLSDIADVVEEHQPLVGDGIVEHDIGLLLIVEKFTWANSLDVTRGVDEALKELEPGLQGITIDAAIFRPATYIEDSINNLGRALIIASILVILVLALFLFEWRVALISVVAIPLSLVAAGLILYLRDATINVMVLAGMVIALGAVVDDAIIDVENIMRRLRQNRREGGNRPIARIVLDASLEVRSAIIFATLIEVVALLPVFFMEGLSGAFFKPLALSYVLAILASMLVALTVTPALSMILLSRAPLERRESPVTRWLQSVYQPLVRWIIHTPRYAYAVVVLIVLLGVTVTPRLGQELLPDFKERDFLMHWLTIPGTSLPEENRITIQSSHELRAIPGVRNFGAHVGQALIMDEVVGVYFGENWVSIDPSVDYDETLAKIQEVVDGYPGVHRDVQTYLKERIREVLTGSSDAIVVRIYGNDMDILRAKAEEIRAHLDEIDGVVDLHVELLKEIAQIEIEVDLERAKAHGLKPGDVRRTVAVLVSGLEVGDIFRNGRAFDVQVWTTPGTRDSVDDVRNLLIDTPRGGKVRLEEVAEVYDPDELLP